MIAAETTKQLREIPRLCWALQKNKNEIERKKTNCQPEKNNNNQSRI